MHRFAACASIGLCLAISVHAGSAQNATSLEVDYLALPDANTPYPYDSTGQTLVDALRIFGRNLRIAVNIDERIKGTIVKTDTEPQTRRAYLDALSEEFGFFWYFDGVVLHIAHVESFDTKVIALTNVDSGAVLDLLERLQIYQPRFIHRTDIRSQTIMVAGPSAYIKTVESAVAAIENSDQKKTVLLRGQKSATVDTNGVISAPTDSLQPVQSESQ